MDSPLACCVKVVFECEERTHNNREPTTTENPQPAGDEQDAAGDHLWADSLLLSARSAYFRAALSFNDSQIDQDSNAKRRKVSPSQGRHGERSVGANEPDEAATKVLKVTYQDQEDLEAGKNIIRMLHDLALPPASRTLNLSAENASYSLLIKMLRWTDYLGSQDCAEACIALLPALDQAQLQLSDIKDVLSLPHQIAPEAALEKVEKFCFEWLQSAFEDASKVKQFSPEDVNVLCSLPPDVLNKIAPACSRFLLSHFDDVYAVIVDAELLANFCKLDFPMVEMWAGLDELVATENDVAILITLWCRGKHMLDGRPEKLSSLLRVAQLSISFRNCYIHQIPWFKPAFDLHVFNALLEGGINTNPGSSSHFAFPPAWVAKCRAGPLPADAANRSELTARFARGDLVGMLAEAERSNEHSSVYSDVFYFGGFYWCIELQLSMPERSLGVFLILSDMPPVPLAPAVKASYSLHHHKSNGQESTLVEDATDWFKSGQGWGYTDAFPGLKVTCSADFEELLHGEHLLVKARLSDVK